MPPSYGSQEYWNTRFVSEPEPFEWLEAPNVLDSFLLGELHSSNESNPKLLHIGCGTSMLSYHLRTLVQSPDQVHNLDYSDVAIKLGRRREKELCNDQATNGATSTFMNWNAVNLLDHKSFLSVCKPSTYSIIVDKSTSDSIACSDDIHIPLPYPIDVLSHEPIDLSVRATTEPIHPVHIMAVHLALATKPGACWIALSYSDDRFPFVDGLYSSRPHIPGFPDTGTLWKLVDKQEIESSEQQTASVRDDGTVTYKPKVFHSVYVMRRTEVPLFVRGAHL
jgi:hypothetical protein